MANSGDGVSDSRQGSSNVSRRKFMSVAALSGAALTSLAQVAGGDRMAEEVKKEKIRRAMLAGPSAVTTDATVAEMDQEGNLTVLRPGKNEWVCVPGDPKHCG